MSTVHHKTYYLQVIAEPAKKEGTAVQVLKVKYDVMLIYNYFLQPQWYKHSKLLMSIH